MTLQSSGAIKFSEIQTEFGGSNPVSASEYYAGGVNVPGGTSGVNGAVPASGTISVSKFYGTSEVTAVFSPTGGTSAGSPQSLSDFNIHPDPATETISCNQVATWTWTRTGNTLATASRENGGIGTLITFTLPSSANNIRDATFTVSGTAGGITRYWTVTLNTEGIL